MGGDLKALSCHSPALEKGSDASLYEALEKVIQEMSLIQKEAMEIKQTVRVQRQPTPMDSFRSSSVAENGSMVGVDDLLLQMKEKLVSNQYDRQIIPVVGMGGTGKTTLAINIYQDRLIKEHFDIRAWVTISQEYSIREILIEVLNQLNKGVGKDLSEEALGEILYKHLFGRKYLIVMDDVWSFRVWDGIMRFLPNNKNGSRIVITTRLSNLASDLPNSSSLEMKLLDETSSWDLLCKTVFGGEGCPLELENIGKEIGKSCKGLPLSIVAVGGFLAKSECTKESWKFIEENFSIIGDLEDYERCLKILHMSYKQLPIYLKPCFLYMGVFPEDGVIRISKLVRLWVAEGFLKPVSGGSTLEEIARVYLKDLADRNLILIHKMGTTGNIKSCKIHDLLRDLCLREAKKEMFYTLTHEGIVNGQRRIVISKNEDISALSSMQPPVRSLILNIDVKLPPLSLRLLRIMDSHAKFIENSHQLVNSRFIQFPAIGFEFPMSSWIFWNIQSLIIEGSSPNAVNAPTDIWYMPHIRHLLLPGGTVIPNPPEDRDDIVLGNLQTLVTTSQSTCSNQVVKRIPNIKKLRIYHVTMSLDDNRDCLNNLDSLHKLESLNYTIHRRSMDYTYYTNDHPLQILINFPHSLKKLCLQIRENDYWEQDVLDKIGLLPFLQKLHLRYGRFKYGQWKTTEGQFRSLKFLYLLDCANLRVWTIESFHFPCLTNLRLLETKGLREIPLDFAEVSTLQEIDVWFCSGSVVRSAKRILEEYEELHGDADLHVHVKLMLSKTRKAALKRLTGPNFHVHWI